jgi:adenylate kinase family enzyme
MPSFECRRCGAMFEREAHLVRHLQKKIECSPSKSFLDRGYLLAEHIKHTQKKYPCGFCRKSFVHECSKYRHRKTCAAFIASKKAEVASEKNQMDMVTRMEELQKEVAKLAESIKFSAAPAPTVAGDLISIGSINTTNNNNNNTMNFYPVVPWDATTVDFTALREDMNIRAYHQAFVTNDPVESLMALHMRSNPPRNYFVYVPSDKVEDARFFDGSGYKRIDDSPEEFKKRYNIYHQEFLQFADSHEAELRDECYYSVLDFETQREKLLSAADKPDRVDVIVRKFSKRAPEIKKNAIEPLSIPVET